MGQSGYIYTLCGRMRKLGFVCLVVVLLAVLSPLVSAEWTEVSSSGDWTQKTREVWQGVDGQRFGVMTWQYLNVSDFAGYHAVWKKCKVVS